MVCVLYLNVGAQTLNVPAGWPNANWTVTGSYATDAASFESDPRTTSNFAFDDDDALSGHEDNIAAESPVIDLTPAFTANEMNIEVTAQYVYRRRYAVEVFRLEYWNAATSAWVSWGDLVTNETGATDNYCSVTKKPFISSLLNIAAFTPAQLAGFKYRILYDDAVAAAGWQFGFCMSSPNLHSVACAPPTGIAVTASSITTGGATFTWDAITGITGFEYVVNTLIEDPVGTGTATTATTYTVSGLASSTVHYLHLRAICSSGIPSPWRTISFRTLALPPVNDNIAGAILLTLNEGTACGAGAITGITNEGSTGSTFAAPSCTGYAPTATNGDIWFKFVAPHTSVTLNASAIVGISSVGGVLYSEAAGVYTEVGTCSATWPKSYTALVPGNTYYLRAWDNANDNIGTFTLCGYYLTCTAPTATYTVASDCASGINQFFVDVNVTSMGSATTLNISDNQGNTATATALGVVRVGPYANSTSVLVTVTNSTNTLCTTTSTARTQTVCPPINDTCAGAIDLATQTSPLSSTTVGATNNNSVNCPTTGADLTNTAPDTYYSILVPAGSTLTIGQTLNDYDSTNIVFYGDCTTQTRIACFDNDYQSTTWANNTGSDQTVYWVQDGYGTTTTGGTFTLAWSLIDCINPVATYTVVSDCANGNEEFFVDTAITSLGSASSLAVYDDRGGSVQVVTETGVYRFGPFANGTPVVITVENEQSTACSLTSPVRTQTACPPANDNCANAIVLTPNVGDTCTVTASGTTVGATLSIAATPCNGDPDDDVWFKFVATSNSHRVTLSAITAITGTSVDAYFQVLSGVCGTTTSLLCSDPDTGFVNGLTVGDTYFVRVYTYYATSRINFNICIGTLPLAPANDLIANATVLTESPTSACANGLAGTTVSASHSSDYACSTTDVDVWYTFTPATTGVYYFQRAVVTGTGNGYISIYSGTSGSLTRLNTSCSVNNFSQALTAGTQYYVSVSTTATTTLSFTLCAYPAPPAPANDLIANAATLTESPVSTCTNAITGTTVSATHSAEYACSATDIDVWYTFTPSTTGIYNFSRTAVSGTGNGYISVYSGTPASLTRLNTSCSVTSFSQALTAGTQYYVSVSSTATAALTYTLCVYPAPPPPANDNCATPTVLSPAATYATGAIVSSNISGTIEAGMVSPTCGVLNATNGRDVWFSVVAPASGTLTIETGTDTGSLLLDTAMQAYRGNCGALIAPTAWCNDDITAGTNIFSRLSLTGLTAGETILVRVWNYGTTASGTFKIAAYDASLSAPSFDNAAFKAYPNPVKDVLKLSYSQDMASVSVFNLLGQQVINKELNASEANVDMSNLSAGTYLVKVTVDNQVKTIKVVKQ